MIWKCEKCQVEINAPDGMNILFCPACGAKTNENSTMYNAQQKSICPVCCSPLNPEDETFICPDCNMVYHKTCWGENKGCATYGCPSVGCLNPPPPVIEVPQTPNNIESKKIQCPHCNTQLEAGTTFCWSCGADLGSDGVVSADAPLAGPWERWAARLIDYILEVGACGFFLGVLFDLSNIPDAVVGIIVAPFAFLLDSAVYAAFGNTLGKWLWGIKIIEDSDMKVSAGKFFYRNLRVYWGGCGLAIPIVSLCTFITQYNLVKKGQPTTYDNILGIRSIEYHKKWYKSLIGIILLIGLFILNAYLSAIAKISV